MYKHKFIIIIILSVFLTISCASSSEAEVESADAKPSVAPTEAISKAEELYKERKDLDKVREAIKTLEQARDMDNRNYEVEWKYARFSYFLGSRKSISEDEAEKVLSKALSAAKIAKRVEPKKPDGHFWYAAILGEQSKRSPLTKGITSVEEIRDAMNKVIELDPNYEGASAYDGLGQLEMGTRNFGGSAEKALEYYEKALDLEKENAYVYLHLAEAYLAVGKNDEARKMIDKVLNLKPDPDFLPEYEEAETEAKKLLKEKF
jgi:tetratricopeptide (TPR) repeat protein